MCYGMGCMWENSCGECRYPHRNFLAEAGCVCMEQKEEVVEEEWEDEE